MSQTRARRLISNALLLANAVFTSESYPTNYYDHFRGKVYSDHAGSLAIQQCDSNSVVDADWDTLSTVSVVAATPTKFDELCYAEFIRFKYTNGAADQTVFRISACGEPFS